MRTPTPVTQPRDVSSILEDLRVKLMSALDELDAALTIEDNGPIYATRDHVARMRMLVHRVEQCLDGEREERR